MNDIQKKIVALVDAAEPKENLEQWVRGYMPKHYKRLSIGIDEARALAEIGVAESYAHFGTTPFFTQSVILGAVMSGAYTRLRIITPSQYGKSWTVSQLGLWLANKGRKAYIAGGDGGTTKIILDKTFEHIQTADDSIKRKLLEPADKIERLQTTASKTKIALRGGGVVEAMSLGESFKDPKKGNQAIGRGGDFIIDEASLVSSDTRAEMGRREFANVDGKEYISVEISNPHNPGQFMDDMMTEIVPAGTLIIWMDIRTSLEEGRVKSKDQITNSDFFKNKSTAKRYLLCELEDYSEESLFGEPDIDDSPVEDSSLFFLGADSAYKGKDDIKVALTALTPAGMLRGLECATINKDNWIDGVTSKKVINDVLRLINAYKIKMLCVDIGYGIWLVEGLVAAATECRVLGINFGAGTTKFRKDAKHFAAVYGDNMRAELHLDLQDLMDNGKVAFKSDLAAALKDQMNAVRGIRKPGNGKTQINPKDEIKKIIGKSPDELDSFLLSIHAALLYSITGGTWLYQD